VLFRRNRRKGAEKSVFVKEKGKRREGNARNDDTGPSDPDEDNGGDVHSPLVVLQRRAEVESGGLVGDFLRDMDDASGFAGNHVLRGPGLVSDISTRMKKGREERREGKGKETHSQPNSSSQHSANNRDRRRELRLVVPPGVDVTRELSEEEKVGAVKAGCEAGKREKRDRRALVASKASRHLR
jgi:hypothetical protein